jgi:hypothetical protein
VMTREEWVWTGGTVYDALAPGSRGLFSSSAHWLDFSAVTYQWAKVSRASPREMQAHDVTLV